MPKQCPEDKELSTKGKERCLKKCKEGTTRYYETQRCRKNGAKSAIVKQRSSPAKKTNKLPRCPRGHRRIRGECVKNQEKIIVPPKVATPIPSSSSSSSYSSSSFSSSSPSSSSATTTVPINPSSTTVPISSSTTTVPIQPSSTTVPISSSTTTVPIKQSSSSSSSATTVPSPYQKSSSNITVPFSPRTPSIEPSFSPRTPSYSPPPPATKKNKRSPLGLYQVYQRLGPRNKEKFRLGSPNEKRRILEERRVNPRNTDSSSYEVSGIEKDKLPYYNMLTDKLKNMVLKKPVSKRMSMLKDIEMIEKFAKEKNQKV